MTDQRVPIAVRPDNGRLVPIDPLAQERVFGLHPGVYHVMPEAIDGYDEEYRRALAFYHSGIKMLFDNSDDCGYRKKFPTVWHLRKHLQRALGFAEPIYRADKSYKLEAHSISKDVIDLDTLRELTNQTRQYVLETRKWDPWLAVSDELKLGLR